ncbi:MAG: hypothetical protein ACKVOT_11655 [Polaromonas sp.]
MVVGFTGGFEPAGLSSAESATRGKARRATEVIGISHLRIVFTFKVSLADNHFSYKDSSVSPHGNPEPRENPRTTKRSTALQGRNMAAVTVRAKLLTLLLIQEHDLQ